jgi:small-conductance mechanosensitive channel
VSAGALGQAAPVGDAPGALGVDFNIVWQTLAGIGTSILARVPYMIIGLLVFLVFVLAARLARGAIGAAGKRTRLSSGLVHLLSRVSGALICVLGLSVAAVIVFPTFKPGDLITGLGIYSVAIGFAFKDILQNFFAGILLLWRQPFREGDEIRTGAFEGVVEEINVRSTRIKTYDGERVVVPNGDVYTNAIVVRTAWSKRRVRFTVGIGYPYSIERAREVLLGVFAGIEGVHKEPEPLVYVSELAPSSVNFTVYFWVDSAQASALRVSDEVATSIKLALDAAQIDMPYPHTVVMFHDMTGTRQGDVHSRAEGAPRAAERRAGAEGSPAPARG